MGFFSSEADDLLQASTETGRAAYSSTREGETVVGTAYKAQSDSDFKKWLEQTERDYKARNNQG